MILNHIETLDSPFRFLNEYLYDSEYFSEMIVNEEDLTVWTENTKSTYTPTRLLDSEGCFHILDIYPLDCDETDCFNQAEEILEDDDRAFEYMQNKHSIYEPIRIYIQDESLFWDFDDFDIIDMELEIKGFDEISEFKKILKKFLKKKEDYDVCMCLIRKKVQATFVNDGLFSRLEQKKKISNYYHSNLFVKNVRIPCFNISIPTLFKSSLIANFEINVFSEDCYPDVTRSKMNDEVCKKLGYAIGRAIHIFILKNTNLTKDKKDFLKAFVNKFYVYNPENEFCKEIEL